MASSSFRLDGGKELGRRLSQLADNVARKGLKQSVTKAAKPMLKDARSRVVRDSGLLAASLGTRVKHYKRTSTTVAIVGPRVKFKSKKALGAGVSSTDVRARPTNYAHLVEGGTKPHYMAKAKFAGIVLTNFLHPGTPPRPFMEPAFDNNKSKALRIMSSTLGAFIEKQAKKP